MVGLPAQEARERLGEAGFEVVLEPRESSEGDVGKVLEQSVPKGRRAEKGFRVVLGVGEGPRLVAASDLSGLTLGEAWAALKKAGLTLGGVDGAPSEDVPSGAVAGQDPEAGEKVQRGDAVRLTLSSGPEGPADGPSAPDATDPEPAAEGANAGSDAPNPATEDLLAVPDVSSAGVEEATRALAAAGCSVAGTAEVPSPEPAGTVLGTDPPVGTVVEPGTPVTLVVSAGPPPEGATGAGTPERYQYGSPAAPESPPADAAPDAPPADPVPAEPVAEPAPEERAAEPAAYDDDAAPQDETEDQYEDPEE